ncbi:MAG TPA: BON domain-containing protein [Solirubrobacteraceae bacterium]|jgi:osmotically-inducible protein OsmY|nr:BON domain-containing protein [Solirubrobacteraceae bacterium]
MTLPASSKASAVVIRRIDDDSVIVEGAVHSFADHESALHAAWELPGVRRVHDELAIQLRPSYPHAAG